MTRINMHTQSDKLHQRPSAYQWTVFFVCWAAGIFAGMDANLFSLMLPQAVRDVANTTDSATVSRIGSFVLSLFLFGWMLGGMAFGVIGDRFGRVKSMAASIAIYSLFTGLAFFAVSPMHLALCRFLTGVGVGGCMLCMSVLLMENWPSRSRAVAIGALIASYQVGVFLSGVIGSFFSEWRETFVIGACPLVLSVFVLWQLRESATWAKDRESQSKSFIAQLQGIFGSDHLRNVIVGGMAFGGLLVGYWASVSWIPTWIHELMHGSSQGTEKNFATMLHGVAAIVGCFVAGWLANRHGRLRVIMIASLGAYVASAIMFLWVQEFSAIVYVLYAALGMFIGMFQAILYIYLPELFPMAIRGSAVGFCLNCGRIVTVVAVLFLGMLVSLFGGYALALFAFSCLYLLGCFAAITGTETRKLAA